MKGVVDTLNSLSEVSRIDLIFFCGSLNCDYSIRLLQSSRPTKCETKINSADLVPTTPAVETVQKYFFLSYFWLHAMLASIASTMKIVFHFMMNVLLLSV